ncbi:hypothetical protein Tco_1439802 [Tanacetum coccineum]
MSTSHISVSSDFDDESTDSFVSYIILSDSKIEDVASPTVVLNYVLDSNTDTESFEVPASPDYTLGSNTETKPFEEDPQEAGLEKSSSSPPPSPSSPPPSPSVSSSPPPIMLPPCKRFMMTSSHQDTITEATTEAITPVRLCGEDWVARERISDLEFRLEDIETRLEANDAREIELGSRARALEDRFEPPENANNKTSGNGVNNETSGSARGVEHTVCSCLYKEFLTCKPSNFNGTEGAVGLTRWFEKIKSVFYICNCAKNFQVNECRHGYAVSSLLDTVYWSSE